MQRPDQLLQPRTGIYWGYICGTNLRSLSEPGAAPGSTDTHAAREVLIVASGAGI